MILAKPKLISLDSSTLGKVAKDYFSSDAQRRLDARTFIEQLTELGVYVALSLTQIIEVIRHQNDVVTTNRLRFLARLPLIAWVRPYDNSWFVGSAVSIAVRELHSLVHEGASNWSDIVSITRERLWETGTGKDMFVEENPVWNILVGEARKYQSDEQYISSIAKSDPEGLFDRKLSELFSLPRRPIEKRREYFGQFASKMTANIKTHGDKRISDEEAQSISTDFALDTIERIENYEAQGGDVLQNILQNSGVPASLINHNMTMGEFGELCVLASKLKMAADKINPPIKITLESYGPEALPSMTLDRRLAAIQQNEQRVSGSDLGDGHISVLSLYCDAIEVDKRTLPFLNRIRRDDTGLDKLMGTLFRKPDYRLIPKTLGDGG